MASYALVRLADSEIVETRDFADAPPDVTRKGIAWLPVEVNDPAFDPATEVKTGPVVTIGKDKITRAWSVRAMSAEELDAARSAQIEAMDLVQLRTLLNHENRIRALEGRPAVAASQFKAALKALL